VKSRTLPSFWDTYVLLPESVKKNAFYNLINNAIPETPQGGSITVRGHLDQDSDGMRSLWQTPGTGCLPRFETASSQPGR
jgi:hypothetical protein